MGIVVSIILFLVLISVLIAVHELGHLLVARANGVFAEAFSIGFGPVLFEKKDKYGTKWRFSIVPLGGYVKMLGDADVASVREAASSEYTEEELDKFCLHRKKPWQRLFVALAGPAFNFIFAILLLFGLAIVKGVPEYTSTITVIGEDSVAYISGLRSGDTVLKANDKAISTFEELKDQITSSFGKVLELEVKRNDKTENIRVEMYRKEDGKIVPIKMLGITPTDAVYKPASFLKAATGAFGTVYFLAVNNIKGIFQIITSKASTKSVGGVISIFKMASQSADSGFYAFISMMAFLSTILGAINLLPIPVLDGGTVAISTIEWIIGRPLNKKFVEGVFLIGLIIVVGLMVLGIWNDLANIRFFAWLGSLFK